MSEQRVTFYVAAPIVRRSTSTVERDIQHVNMRGMVLYQKGILVTAHEPKLMEVCELMVEHPGLEMTAAGINKGWFYRAGEDGRWTRETHPEQCDCGNDSVHLRAYR
jgi:hypothetical protein